VICVDASVAVKWVLEEQQSAIAERLYYSYRDEGIIAPSLMPIEVTNAVWRRVNRGLLTPQRGQEALDRFLRLEVDVSTASRMHQIAFGLAERFQRPTVYDMHYVALAQLADCDLWTADLNLLNALGGRVAFVRSLGAFRS
jgi:predicted nucleic acid-binding protein